MPLTSFSGNAVGGEQHPHRGVARLVQFLTDRLGLGGDPACGLGIAADRPADARPGIGRSPQLQRGLGRGRRILRIERQQHHFVGAEHGDVGGRLLGQRVPVAHGDEDPDLVARQPFGQRGLQRLGLGCRLGQQRRAPAHEAIVGLGGGLAPAGDQPGQRRPQQAGQADDGRVIEQVEQEGFDRGLIVRPAQIEQDHGDPPPLQPRPIPRIYHWAPIRFSTCSTWSMGTSGRMPWPRLKIHGPCPQASIS